jgi:hypothetical protein
MTAVTFEPGSRRAGWATNGGLAIDTEGVDETTVGTADDAVGSALAFFRLISLIDVERSVP